MTTLEKILAVGNGIMGIFVIYGTLQISRLDAAFTQIGDIKASVAKAEGEVGKTAISVSYIQKDLDEMKSLLKTIDGKLASNFPVKPTYYRVNDLPFFGKELQNIKLKDGFFITPVNPSDAEILEKFAPNK